MQREGGKHHRDYQRIDLEEQRQHHRDAHLGEPEQMKHGLGWA